MANEPEQTAHDRLTAYAAERRRQLGADPSLPPDTRRALLAEVDRTYDRGPATPRFAWWPWRALATSPAWAIAAFLVLLAGGGAWLALGRKEPTASLLFAKQDRRPEFVPAAPLPRPAPPSAESASTPVPATPVPATPVPATPVPATPVPATPVPAPAVAPVVRQAPAGSPAASRLALRQADEPTATSVVDSGPVPAKGLPPRSDAGSMADSAALATNTVFRVEPRKPTEPRGTLFVNRSAPVPMVRSIAGEPQRLAVLERFSVESAGDQLRIVDADGSVYEGNLSAVPATRTAAARRATESTAVRGGGSVPLAAPSSGALGRSGPAAPAQKAAPAVSAPRDGAVAPPVELAFQALGTNRSTRQLVQIEGRLVVTNQSVPGVPPEDLRSGARPEVLQNLLRQSVLRGQARLGEPHATIPIEAVPTGP